MGYRSGVYPLPACTGYPALESCDGSLGGACVSDGYWVFGGRETWGAGIGLGEWATWHLGTGNGYKQHFTLIFSHGQRWNFSPALVVSIFRCRTNCSTHMGFLGGIAFNHKLFIVTQT